MVVVGVLVDGAVRCHEFRYDPTAGPGTVIAHATRDVIAALAEALSLATSSPEATLAESGAALTDRR